MMDELSQSEEMLSQVFEYAALAIRTSRDSKDGV